MGRSSLLENLKAYLLEGVMFYHHLLCPVLSFILFVFLEEGIYTSEDAVFASTPVLIYGITIVIANLMYWTKGPYPFLMVYEQPWYMSLLWGILLLGGSYLLARGLIFLHNRFTKK